jgi:hypothetical protein
MAQKIKIIGLDFDVPLVSVHTAQFEIAENYPGAVYTDLGTETVYINGTLQNPIITADLTPGTTYKIRTTLDCGTSFIKTVTIQAGCPEPENLTVQLFNNNNTFVGILLNFTPIVGTSLYSLSVYRDASPGNPGAIFVGRYDVLTPNGSAVLTIPELYVPGVTYYIALAIQCSDSEIQYGDYISYEPEILKAIPTGVWDDPDVNIEIALENGEVAPTDLTFQVYYRTTDTVLHGPMQIVILNGDNSGSGTETSTVPLDVNTVEITSVNPNTNGTTLITF